MDAFRLLCRLEGIILPSSPAHAIAGAVDLAGELAPGGIIVVNLSGRGDKDVETAARWFGLLDSSNPLGTVRERHDGGTQPGRPARVHFRTLPSRGPRR